MKKILAEDRRRQRGFTLVEILAVLAIIGIVSVVALPSVMSSLNRSQVSEGVRTLQVALAAARDAAARDNVPRGIRLLPDTDVDGRNPTTGLLDPAFPLVSSRLQPIGSAPDYSEGLLSTWQGPLPAAVTALPCLMVFEAAGTWVKPDPLKPYIFQIASPTSWFWNVRIGDKVQLGVGSIYTVVGPMITANPELFCNIGTPGTVPSLSVTINSPDGQSVTVNPEFLLLVNGKDDNGNGWIDEGFDGVDNNSVNGIDEAAEWEPEKWLGSVANQGLIAAPYVIHRTPAPIGGAHTITMPASVVIDLSTWGTTQERSRLPLNRLNGYVDVMISPNGSIVPSTIYSTPTSVGMGGAFYHFWVAERSDVYPPAGAAAPLLPVPPSTANPQPNRFGGAAIKGEYGLVTLFARSGMGSQQEGMVFDWTNVGLAAYSPSLPFFANQMGDQPGFQGWTQPTP